ncbi:MAG: DNA polymerase I [Eubacteriales bacterium]|nr:DNA polymerase I [Eubacteriales bacterium]
MTNSANLASADLLLLDGNSILNRAHFAMARGKRLTAPDGTPTAAVYSFFNMLFSYQDLLKPGRTVVCFDRSEPTFRKEIFTDYKAGRRPMDEDLAQQVPLVKEGLSYMGVDRVELAGYEADDLIATLSREAEEKGLTHIYVLSGDRDLWQLISDHVTLIYPYNRKGERGKDLMTPEIFRETYGFEPKYLLDYKALRGDSSDNIPGVKGIGEKSGQELIRAYGNIKEVYANLDQIKPRQAKLLTEGKKQAELSYQLAQLCFEAPYEPGYVKGELTEEKLLAYFDRLGFRSFHQRFELEQLTAKDAGALTENWEQIAKEQLLDQAKGHALYIWPEHKKIYLADQEQHYCVLNQNSFIKLWQESLREQSESKLVFWAGKELLRDLELAPPSQDYYDVEIASYLLNLLDSSKNTEHNLRSSYESLSSDLPSWENELKQAAENFGEEDAAGILQLAVLVRLRALSEDALKKDGLDNLAQDMEFPLARVLAKMEDTGIALDREALDVMAVSWREELYQLEQQIYFYFGREINLNSSKQLGEVLFEELKLPGAKKTKSGSYSTAAEILEGLRLAHPAIPLILEYRELSKLLSTFVDGLAKSISADGRIHTVFKQTLTSTGRLSSAEPNLQNIPVKSERAKDIRDSFVAGQGQTFIDADYSQIELRLLAILSQDENLLAAFREGEDIHSSTAAKLFNKDLSAVSPSERRDAKTVNFSIVYGISDFGLSQNLDISVMEARRLIEAYDENYPKVRPWMQSQAELAKERGYVETILGRRRYIPELKSRNYQQRKFGERAAMNAPVQGSAADLIKLAMLRVDKAIEESSLKARLLLQVHDELLLECPKEETEATARLLREAMEDAMDLDLPLKVELSQGQAWGSMENMQD